MTKRVLYNISVTKLDGSQYEHLNVDHWTMATLLQELLCQRVVKVVVSRTPETRELEST